MKKLLLILMIATILSSCSKDDNCDGSIIGTWGAKRFSIIKFNNDGTGVNLESRAEDRGIVFEYERSDNELFFTNKYYFSTDPIEKDSFITLIPDSLSSGRWFNVCINGDDLYYNLYYSETYSGSDDHVIRINE